MMNMREPLAYRLKEVARILGLSQRSVWKLAHDGQIPCLRVGKALLFPVKELEEWLSRQVQKKK